MMGPVLIFDADCGMCTRFAHSGLVRSARVRSVGYQSIDRDPGLARIVRGLGIDRRAFAAAMVLVEGGRVHVGARAFNVLLVRAGGWPARAGAVLSLPLVCALEALVYRAIAAHRGRLSVWLGASMCVLASHPSLDSSGGSRS
ncbi:MAG: DCC1-like thiol-disulfide oxidoreductase family protein [Candidatus Velthaea sp.]|jgi:predicted DCC family thiol-disulfide oxidoreductase YuxK